MPVQIDVLGPWAPRRCRGCRWLVKAKFHYTGPTGHDRTRTDFAGDRHGPTEFLGDPGRSGPGGSGRARVEEFSQYQTKSADFVWSGPVRSGPCSEI